MTIYKLKRKIKDFQRKVKKRISKIKIDKKFYFYVTTFLIMIILLILARPYRSPIYEVEIKNVNNYTVQVATNDFTKDVSIYHTHFINADEEKNILKKDDLYIYMRFHYEIQRF